MTCLVIRLSLHAECGACGGTVPPGRAVITDQIESPVFVPVCENCELGLDGVAAAATLRGMKPRRDSADRSADGPKPGRESDADAPQPVGAGPAKD